MTLVALKLGVEKLCKHKVCCILLACANPLQYGFGISQHWEALSYFFLLHFDLFYLSGLRRLTNSQNKYASAACRGAVVAHMS